MKRATVSYVDEVSEVYCTPEGTCEQRYPFWPHIQ
jgi:hypothetical protein